MFMIATLFSLIKSLILALGKDAAFDFLTKQIKNKISKNPPVQDIQTEEHFQKIANIVNDSLKENEAEIKMRILAQYKKIFKKLLFIMIFLQIIQFFILYLVVK